METRKMKLALSAGALALSMALVGCGGGGSNAVVSPPSAEQPPAEQPSAAMTAATNAINAALAAVDALTITSEQTEIDRVQGLINTASTRVDALPDDEEASYRTRIAAIQTDHDNAEQRVVVAGAIQAASAAVDALMITSEQTEIDRVQGLINDARNAIDDLPDAEEAPQDAVVARIQTRHDTAEAGAVAERNRVIAEGNQQTTEEQRRVLAEVSRLFEVVTSERRNAAAAQKAAEDTRTDARKKYGALSATKVKGESETAETNAQAVLDAVGKVDQEATKAKAAHDALVQAKTAAEALDDSVSQKAELIAAIEAAIKDAKANYDAAKALADARGANSVFLLARTIRGGEGGDDTPADKGREVAAEILAALTDGPEEDSRPSGTQIGNNLSLLPIAYSAAGVTVKNSNHDAPSFLANLEDIAGNAANIEQRVFGTAQRSLVSLKDMSTSVLTRTGSTGTSPIIALGPSETAVANSGGYGYKGISGEFFCLIGSGRCSAPSDGKIGAGWYFRPTSHATRLYEPHPTNENQYSVYEDYAEYGYWLSDSDSSLGADLDRINTFANSYAARDTGASLNTPNIDNDLGKATYEGKALGMSVVTGRHEDDANAALESGEFTATVELEAEFGATPVVSGEIHSFEGTGTRSNWRVRLLDLDLSTAEEGGVAQTGGENNGTWRANPYGGNSTAGELARPVGIIGDFEVDFVDGRAVGAYATRKQ